MNKILFIALSATILFSSCSKTPTAAFKYEQPQQGVPSKVTFKNESLNSKTYEWDFGDGKKATDVAPSHEYKSPGNYTVTLRVVNGKKEHISTQNITVTMPKDADLYNYYHPKGGGSVVELTTSLGTVKILLFDATPKHRDNFIKLVKEGFYNDLLFHRVIKGFMAQGGDPTSRGAAPNKALGFTGTSYLIPAEFKNELIHVKGALAAARTGGPQNPEKESSGSQFYIVQGNLLNDNQLDQMEARSGVKYTVEQRALYKTYGGTPFLDHDYTVFGQVIEGLDVIDKMCAVKTAPGDRPVEDLKMTFKVSE
jgi:cyclophilin family peptidyl-prolyl cis-trans isomerase